ncbi:2-dehydro-3-deoxygalactonokinase [Stakelama pacifica]|uniref:2-keto-3-deoxygalactonate kinase n=1 Tax=Stakelama pacifica TaxID=517720 RepID=A0A4V3BSA7_9SPHN|nr:2-dehydro-3-deoxygalactonokinase [Stakelama pacifica]TDN77768.1 2-keto-3-deoxygalactonate kinase [Stakelama pacifica]GGP00851.1 2-keto-3-deoxy-galactonokinase [Stakelama pacifica]
MAEFIAVDWGTTNRRAYHMGQGGAVLRTERDDRGLTAIAPGGFAAEARALRARFGDLPMLCAGMVGSVRGWADAGYRACPVSIDDLAGALCWVEPGRTAIVAGASHVGGGRGDVMRGEEVQFLGAVAAGFAPADSLLCQPGTHCKWARMAGGRIASFRTTMTGEIFALLRKHSLLADFLNGEVKRGAAFQEGLAASADGALLGDLFGERASVLLGLRAEEDVAAHTSGLLIGSDVREQGLHAGETVYVLADPGLGDLYCAAIEHMGAQALLIDSHAAFAAGISHIWEQHQ